MAKATKNREQVVTITETVKLELSMREAEFLASLLRNVAGNSDNSPREHANGIASALTSAGVVGFEDERYTPGVFLTLGAKRLRHVDSLRDQRYVGPGVRYNDYPRDWSEEERG